MSEHYTIGIDISKGPLDCHALPYNKTATFANLPAGFAQLLRWARSFAPGCIAFEATGRYQHNLERALHKHGLPAHRCSTSQAAMFCRVMQDRAAKTDALDAFRLASDAAMHKLQPDTDCDPQQVELSDLSARRDALVRNLTAEKYRQKDATTALLACLPELGEMNAKQVVSLAGIVPNIRESGTWKGRGIISGGRSQLGTKLYMAALRAGLNNPPFKASYVGLKASGKTAKLALLPSCASWSFSPTPCSSKTASEPHTLQNKPLD